MYLGVDYYPEHWDPTWLEQDLQNIKELNSNVIRIGEFAWHMMEATPGQYDFSYFDRVIAAAKQQGLAVIFGTPTATPPAWLIQAHPEILSEFADGAKRAYGGRHVACYSAPAYLEACRKIVRVLAEHYREEDGIIAWQIDNELGHEDSDLCWCEACREGFQAYLREKYAGDIERLNRVYGTRFWSQEYNDFREIPLPSPTITTHNPALRLDWERFRSQVIVDFHNEQVEILRSILGNEVTIIHDFPGGGLYKHVDYAQVAKKLDVVAYNNYPVWGGQKEPLPPHEIAFELDYIRGLKQKNFWITEAIMGAQGHDVTGYLPRPRQAQMWSMQSVARGCAALMYFRYRGAIQGAEQYCYGILDADNQKRRKFYEVQEVFATLKQLDSLPQSPVKAKVAVVYDYDSLASFRIQRQSLLLDPPAQLKYWHRFFHERNIMVDVISANSSETDWKQYAVIIVPHLLVHQPDFFKQLKECAEQGAQVLLTYRSSVKDLANNLVLGANLPIHLTEWVGGYVEESESVQETDCFTLQRSTSTGTDWPETATAGIFREMFKATTAEVLYTYQDAFYREYAALTRRQIAQGAVYYVSTTLAEPLMEKLVDTLIIEAKLKSIDSPAGVEVIARSDGEKRVFFVMNHTGKSQSWSGVELAPYDWQIISADK